MNTVMKFIELENISNSRLVIKATRLIFNPGEKKKVHPSTIAHPSIKGLIGSGLRIVNNGKAPVKEPKAPELTTITTKTEEYSEKIGEPIATVISESAKVNNDSTTESIDQSSGIDLRELYISAPGITEDNVDVILQSYPTLEELKKASKDDFLAVGVYKSQVKKLCVWVTEQ